MWRGLLVYLVFGWQLSTATVGPTFATKGVSGKKQHHERRHDNEGGRFDSDQFEWHTGGAL
jgi:hypothetical protein